MVDFGLNYTSDYDMASLVANISGNMIYKFRFVFIDILFSLVSFAAATSSPEHAPDSYHKSNSHFTRQVG